MKDSSRMSHIQRFGNAHVPGTLVRVEDAATQTTGKNVRQLHLGPCRRCCNPNNWKKCETIGSADSSISEHPRFVPGRQERASAFVRVCPYPGMLP
eukprot:3971971-Amphidinium_carterae.1